MNPSEPNNTPPVPEQTPAFTPVEATPVAPQASEAPFANGTPVMAGAPAPKNSKNKKIALIVGIVAGVVILAVLAVTIFMALTAVSKDDYRAAAKQFNEVSRANSKLNTAASGLGGFAAGGGSAQAKYEEALTNARESVDGLKTSNEELGKLKAVRVGEGADHYKAFDEKVDAYVQYATDLVASVEGIRPAMLACSEVPSAANNDARLVAIKACAADLGEVKDLPNADFTKFVSELKKGYDSYATIFEQMNALTSPSGAQRAQYMTLRTSLYEAQDGITAASKEFSAALNASDDKHSVKDTAKVLADFLNEQQR